MQLTRSSVAVTGLPIVLQLMSVVSGRPEKELLAFGRERRQLSSTATSRDSSSTADTTPTSPILSSAPVAATFFPSTTTVLTISTPSPSTASSPDSSDSGTALSPSSTTPAPSTSTESAVPTSEGSSHRHRNLIIILSTVLGSFGIILLGLLAFLLFRRWQRQKQRGRHSFSRKGSSPINDDEIESWRGTMMERKPGHPSADLSVRTPRLTSLDTTADGKDSPGSTTWDDSPATIRPAHLSTKSADERFMVVTRAPNSRIGLTDESVPGSDPYVGPLKRQSSRLSRPGTGTGIGIGSQFGPGHARTKSRRSSFSARSARSILAAYALDAKAQDDMPLPYRPRLDEDIVGRQHARSSTKDLDADADIDMDNDGGSLYDEPAPAGGLSPRPNPRALLRPWEQNT